MKHPDLSPTEQQILEFIGARLRATGLLPTVREIGQAVGLRSSATVHRYLQRLEQLGYIRRLPRLARAIEVLRPTDQPAQRVPILGRTRAGAPILAVEEAGEYLGLEQVMGPAGDFFALQVTGDSMVGAGILPGDYVVVRRQPMAQPGDVVVALIGDEVTVKRLKVVGGRPVLFAENPAYPPIADTEFTILGRVVALVRDVNG